MASELKLSFEFDRYVNGTRMAEGVTIERASTLEKAMVAAARIAPKGPNGETPVLVYRPAPAATDTGLETAVADLEEIQQAVFGSLGSEPNVYADYDRLCELSRKMRETIRSCSQAEELLAAERAKTERWHKKAMDAGVIVHSDGTTSHPMRKERDDLKADSAAQAARIKELEQHSCDNGFCNTDHWYDKAEALEAKLAAAEKALEPFAAHANDRAVDDTGWRDKETVKIVVSIGDLRKARAVLGGMPSC